MTRSSAETLSRDLREGAEDVGRAAQRAARRVRADAAELAAEAQTASREVAHRATAFAKARPGVAIAIAAGLGALLAFAFRRRPR